MQGSGSPGPGLRNTGLVGTHNNKLRVISVSGH
uniref:Uncharacterized protein n=1 Tax=Anguilla anguilla TaxID=7936 RepID=A0A0E9U3Y9_ANGAN